MKRIKLTQGKYALVDDADYEWLSQYNWHYHDLGYARNAQVGYMHRFINATQEGYQTDHINQNKLDNRRVNLRTVTAFVNQVNKSKSRNNTSGITGVRWDKSRNRWRVSFRWLGKVYYGGDYISLSAAEKSLKRRLQDVRTY